jgi:hypothetical protein
MMILDVLTYSLNMSRNKIRKNKDDHKLKRKISKITQEPIEESHDEDTIKKLKNSISNSKTDNTNKDDIYVQLLLGDLGEIEKFKEKTLNDKSDSTKAIIEEYENLKKLNNDKDGLKEKFKKFKENLSKYFVFYDEEYQNVWKELDQNIKAERTNINKMKNSKKLINVKISDKIDKANLTKDLLIKHNCHKKVEFKNFDSVIDKIKQNSSFNTDTAILGDAIYVDAKKFYSLEKKLRDLDKTGPKVYVNENDEVFIYDNITASEIKKNNLRPFYIKHLFINEIRARLICGLLKLNNMIDEYPILKDKTSILNGNHSYDFSIEEEEETTKTHVSSTQVKEAVGNALNIKPLKKKKKTRFDKMINDDDSFAKIYYQKEKKVLFLDIDSSYLVCSKEIEADNMINGQTTENFEKCPSYKFGLANYHHFANKFVAIKMLKKYQDVLKDKLNEIAKIDGSNIWKIVRMHQPIFNSEADSDIKNNRTFMDLFKNAGIHAYFVSHNHSAQFDISLFEDTDLGNNKQLKYMNGGVRCDTEERKGIEPKLTAPLTDINKVSNSTITDDTDPYYGTEENRFGVKSGELKTCSRIDRSKAFLKHHFNNKGRKNLIKIDNNNKELILQVLVGNSGRTLDGIFSDRFSDLTQLFATTGVNQFGYATATFDENDLVIKYFINGDENEIFEIKINKSDMSNKKAVEENFTEKFVYSISNKFSKQDNKEKEGPSLESQDNPLTSEGVELLYEKEKSNNTKNNSKGKGKKNKRRRV